MTALTHLTPGATIPEHGPGYPDETVTMLSGDFFEAVVRHRPGALFAGRAGTRRGFHTSVSGGTAPPLFSGTLDCQIVT